MEVQNKPRLTYIQPGQQIFRMSYAELLELMRKGGANLPTNGEFSFSFSPSDEKLILTFTENLE